MVGGEGGGREPCKWDITCMGRGGGKVPQVPQVQVHWNSLNVHEKYTNSAKLHEKRTFSKTGCHFCEFCENDARFPWVELVDFPKNSPNVDEKHTKSVNNHKKRTNSANVHAKMQIVGTKNIACLQILRKWRTFPMGIICRFSKNHKKSTGNALPFRQEE